MRNSYKEEWLAGLFTSTSKAKEILVKFKGRKDLISYTDEILALLKTDKQVDYICDAESGEIIYDSEPVDWSRV